MFKYITSVFINCQLLPSFKDGVRAHEGHSQPGGASSLCYNSAFEATVPGRDRTFPGCHLRCAWIVWTERTRRFAYWLYTCRVIECFMYVFRMCVFVCMYVPAADRIAAAINRGPFGLLLACLYSPGHSQPRGASSLCNKYICIRGHCAGACLYL